MANELRVRRIIVPVDGSECSRYAADRAVRIAAAYGAEVLFLHVVDEQVVETLVAEDDRESAAAVRERLIANGEGCLHALARLADDIGVRHREVVVEGDPCAVICETATTWDADVIVMGKIGRRGARRIVVGSITRRVIEASNRPVLVITERREAA